MKTNAIARAATLTAVVALSACGGGSSGSGSSGVPPGPAPTTTPTAGPTATPSASSTARITISDPSSGTFAAKRRPSHLPRSTQTIAVTVNGGTPVSFPYAVNGPTCVVNATTNACTFDVTVPTGNDTIQVQALDASAKPLSSATVQQVVSGITVVPVTLAGIPAVAYPTIAQDSAPAGTPTNVPVTVHAQDVDGNPIAGPYATPVTLTDSDKSGHSSISPDPVTSSTQTVNLVLDGKIVNATLTGPGMSGSITFVSSLVTHEFTVPSKQMTAANAGTGSIVLGGDGAMWFGEQTGIGRADASGAINEYTMVQPQRMVRGADGAVWFTTYYDSSTGVSGELCRVDANGGVTKRNIGLFASGIVTGPDGNFWIADGNAYIARVTPTGVVTKFPLTAGANTAHANNVALGPDGNLWVFDESLQVLDVVSTAGTQIASVAISPLPQFGTGFSNVTFGSDGAFWYAASDIGRVSTSGALTELNGFLGTLLDLNGIGFTPPIVSASDGNIWTTGMWFSPTDSAAMFRVVPSTRTVLTVALPIVGAPNLPQPPAVGVGNGANGTIWFVRGNSVGWFTPPA